MKLRKNQSQINLNHSNINYNSNYFPYQYHKLTQELAKLAELAESQSLNTINLKLINYQKQNFQDFNYFIELMEDLSENFNNEFNILLNYDFHDWSVQQILDNDHIMENIKKFFGKITQRLENSNRKDAIKKWDYNTGKQIMVPIF